MSEQGNPSRRATIYDVATAAGVSHMTVSRVLNDHPNIRESTRAKVLAVIRELGYRPSVAARALATSRAMTIGVIVDRPGQYGPRSALLALETAARAAGYDIRTFSLHGAPDGSQMESAVSELQSSDIDAACAIVRRFDWMERLRGLADRVPTVVAADIGDLDMGLRSVAVDQSSGTRTAVRYLADLGHRAILHLSGVMETVDGSKRERAWRDCMADLGQTDPRLAIGDWTADAGYDLGAHGDLAGVTAIIAGNDQMALGLLHGLRSRGLRVPEDISVIGYDDQPEASHFWPPLTTVRQDFAALGNALMSGLLEAMTDPSGTSSTVISTELIVRDSACPPARDQ